MFCNKMLELQRLYRQASLLALITIYYNLGEGVVSVWFGAGDETIALFGFGVDSFVEVISGVGIWHLVRRLGRGETADRDTFERQALRVTGGAFYLLTAGLLATAVLSLLQGHQPQTTRWGIIVSLVSIVSMQVLIHFKTKVGTALNSPAILADAACTRTCLRLSVVLLLASLGYQLTGIGSLDAIGSLVIAVFSFLEGREAFQKARGLGCGCSCACGTGLKSEH
ncbi:membrane protein [Geomonas limicola]|uniref:Membrane protein n=1 Tax=Geomonas limicola TaxID=2740186 RepID=A0A6V8N9Q5_9BACT|nr:cation transporter [Geomonas limicola]GFO69271.1 membrane protein [Geomonas limicola]